MTDTEKLAALIAKIETIVPYVTATIGSGATMPVAGKPNWVAVVGGRCTSSERQLEALLKMAREMRST